MLSLLKKNSGKTKSGQTPAWHTNFCITTALPDTKLVRTSFFVNGFLVLLAAGISTAVVYQELNLSELSSQLESIQQQVQKSTPASSRAVAQYKKFQAEEQKITELDNFLKTQKLACSEVIIRLAQTKPSSIALQEISYDANGVKIRGYAQGISEQATTAASSYEKQLKEDAVFSKVFRAASMTNVSRDTEANRLTFEIAMLLTEIKARSK